MRKERKKGWMGRKVTREDGEEQEKGGLGGKDVDRDQCMIICSLGRTLTENFLSTS